MYIFRVAIEFRYSTHSGIDMRALALEKKHLQKLGYRVVEVSDLLGLEYFLAPQ